MRDLGLFARIPSGWRAATVAVALAAVSGAVLGLVLPRGPVTTGQALVTLGACAVIGFLTGAVMRSRWAVLVTPAVLVVAFEVARIGASGPTVDTIPCRLPTNSWSSWRPLGTARSPSRLISSTTS